MKVLVFGASGSIGFPVARALTRAGHVVYGQTRFEENKKLFLSNEILPVVGDPESTEWHHLIASVDAVVDCLASVPTRSGMSTTVLNNVIALRSPSNPITYVYTSGTWMYGHTEDVNAVVSDATVITEELKSFTQLAICSKRDRVEREHLIRTSPSLVGVVLRPGIVYGGPKSLLSPLFNTAAKERKIVWPKYPGETKIKQRYASTHVEDLADLYVRAVEKVRLVAGLTIATTADSGLVEDFLERVGEIVGAKGGIEYFEASSPYDVAMASTQVVRPYVAKALLGWAPTKPGMVDSAKALLLAHIAGNHGFDDLLRELA